MHLTLVSTVDDSVIRHPFNKTRGGQCEHPANTLARHTLYGNPILISSAFLVHNTDLRNLLLDGQDNILKAMVRNGRLFVISPTKSVYEDVFSRANSNEHIAKRFIQSPANLRLLKRLDIAFSSLVKSIKHSCFYEISSSSRSAHDRYRKTLIESIFRARHPSDLDFDVSERFFDQFRDTLRSSLVEWTPRSACEQALSALSKRRDFDVYNDLNRLTDNVMTFANEAFYLSRAAALSESNNVTITLETHFSARFQNAIPYKNYSGTREKQTASVRIPLIAIISNFNSVIDKIFQDKYLSDARSLYTSDRSISAYAESYEVQLSKALGMKESVKQQLSYENWRIQFIVGALGVTSQIGLGIYRKYQESKGKMDKRAFIGGVAASGIMMIVAECLIGTYGPGLAADAISPIFTSVEGIDTQLVHDESIEKLLDMQPSPSLDLLADASPRRDMALMQVDVDSKVFKEWKISEVVK